MTCMNVIVSVFLAGVSGLAMASCGAQVEPLEVDQVDEEGTMIGTTEDVSLVEQGVGETACGIVPCTAANSCANVNVPACGLAPAAAVSPNANYGSAACPGQFIARDTTPPTTGGKIYPYVQQGSTIGKGDCPNARMYMALFAKTSVGVYPIGSITATGQWSDAYGICGFTTTQTTPYVVATPQLLEVRAVGRVSVNSNPIRVKVGLRLAACG